MEYIIILALFLISALILQKVYGVKVWDTDSNKKIAVGGWLLFLLWV